MTIYIYISINLRFKLTWSCITGKMQSMGQIKLFYRLLYRKSLNV